MGIGQWALGNGQSAYAGDQFQRTRWGMLEWIGIEGLGDWVVRSGWGGWWRYGVYGRYWRGTYAGIAIRSL